MGERRPVLQAGWAKTARGADGAAGKGREELTYLESVVQELSQAEAEQDFNDIRAELESGGT